MNITKKSIKTLLTLAVLITFSGVLRVFFFDEHGFDNVSSFYLIILGVLFLFEMERMLVQGNTKRNLLICAGWILVVLLIRGARYSVFRDLDQFMRYLWYFYYIPLLLIPYYSLCAAVSVGNPEENSKNKILLRVFGILSVVLIVLVLSNDVHQFVFHLHKGYEIYWRDEYTYGLGYWLMFGWMYLVLLGSFCVLIYKCRISACRRYVWIPLTPIVIGTVWIAMIAFGAAPKIGVIQPIEFPETFAFVVGGTWLCCISIGLVPANKSYEELFHLSNVGAFITNNDGEVIYRSRNAVNPEQDSPDLLVREEQIRGGRVYWQSDISERNRINEELESIHQQLSEEAELISLENKMREKNVAITAKNEMYDAIAVRVFPQSKKIAELSFDAGNLLKNNNTTNVEIQGKLRMIGVYGSYIKRMANLMVVAAQKKSVSLMELALAIAETLRQLDKMGVQTAIHTEENYPLAGAEVSAKAYENFMSYVEQSLPGLSGIYVTVKRNECRLTLEGNLPANYETPKGTSVEYDDEVRFVTILLTEGGDGV